MASSAGPWVVGREVESHVHYEGVSQPCSTLWNRKERNKAVHGRSFRSRGEKIVFGSIQNLGPRQPSHNEREFFAHATVQHVGAQNVSNSICSDVNLHQTRLHLCPRSVGPFGRAVRSGRSVLLKKNGSKECSSSS